MRPGPPSFVRSLIRSLGRIIPDLFHPLALGGCGGKDVTGIVPHADRAFSATERPVGLPPGRHSLRMAIGRAATMPAKIVPAVAFDPATVNLSWI